MSDDEPLEYLVKPDDHQPCVLSVHHSLDDAKVAAMDGSPPLPGYRHEWRTPTPDTWELWEIGEIVKYEQCVCIVEARPRTF